MKRISGRPFLYPVSGQISKSYICMKLRYFCTIKWYYMSLKLTIFFRQQFYFALQWNQKYLWLWADNNEINIQICKRTKVFKQLHYFKHFFGGGDFFYLCSQKFAGILNLAPGYGKLNSQNFQLHRLLFWIIFIMYNL